MTMDLKQLILPEKTVEFDFPGIEGLKFKLSFLSRDAVNKIQDRCTEKKYHAKSRVATDELNEDRFLEEYVGAIIKSWSGFKSKYLADFILINEDEIIDPESELPYTEENAVLMMKNSTLLDNWVSDCIKDLTNFTKKP